MEGTEGASAVSSRLALHRWSRLKFRTVWSTAKCLTVQGALHCTAENISYRDCPPSYWFFSQTHLVRIASSNWTDIIGRSLRVPF